MKRNDNAVVDCKCDQFCQVEVCTEHDKDCAVSLQISRSALFITVIVVVSIIIIIIIIFIIIIIISISIMFIIIKSYSNYNVKQE